MFAHPDKLLPVCLTGGNLGKFGLAPGTGAAVGEEAAVTSFLALVNPGPAHEWCWVFEDMASAVAAVAQSIEHCSTH